MSGSDFAGTQPEGRVLFLYEEVPMRFTKRIKAALFVVLFLMIPAIVSLIASGCGGGADEKKTESFSVGIRSANDHVPFLWAEEKNLYSEEGLECEIRIIDSNKTLIDGVARGEMQMGAAPISAVIAAITSGIDVKIIGMTGRGSDALIAGKDSSVNCISDLEGKKVATIKGSILDILLLDAMDKEGVDIEEVEFIYFTTLPDLTNVLKSGQVDAVSTTEPFLTIAQSEGWAVEIVRYDEYWINHPCCCVFAAGDFLEYERDKVVSFMRAHRKSVEASSEDLKKASELLFDTIGSFDYETILESMSEEKMALDWEIYPEDVERMASIMLKHGIIEDIKSISEYLDLSIQKEI